MHFMKRLGHATSLSLLTGKWVTRISLTVLLVLISSGSSLAQVSDSEQTIDFNRDIRPLLSDKCFFCHGPDEAERHSGLRLDIEEQAHESAFLPGDVEGSLAWERIISEDEAEVMPPTESNKSLSADERELIRRWIEAGAPYEGHWSFRPLEKTTATPESASPNPVDAYIRSELANRGLAHNPPAARETLIRRVTLDLTGLPPTLDEVDAFVNDTDENAYEKVVDRLLASPRYGERMTLEWLDVARYGDTSVFHADGPRDMWRWRDWVTEAYNNNMPFDEFTIKQIAGDLLPNATVEDKVASGFNRNNASTDEGGLIEEEYRIEYAVDRVKTTSMVWMGLSMECAQCHDHKYDPISQEEYYRFFAFFNQAADPGRQTRAGNQVPIVELLKPENEPKIPATQQQLDKTKKEIAKLRRDNEKSFVQWKASKPKSSFLKPGVPPYPLAKFDFDRVSQNTIFNTVDPSRHHALQPVGKKLTATLPAGRNGNGLDTNGEKYAQSSSNKFNFERTDQFSFGCLVRSKGKASGALIAKMNNPKRHAGYDLYTANNHLSVHLIHNWPGNAIKVTTKEKVLTPGKWQHVLATYDGSSKAAGIKLYVDGIERPWKIEKDNLTKSIRNPVALKVGRRESGSIFTGTIDDVTFFDSELSAADVGALVGSDPIAKILATDPYWRTKSESELLKEAWLKNSVEGYEALLQQRDSLDSQLQDLKKPMTTVMVMADLPTPRMTYVLNRGQYDSPDKARPVEPNVPDFLPPLPESAPRNRLGLAQWLVSSENPLTARVTVNRIWKTFFGEGIVETVEDFGSQGLWPSHPELLDWMASDFVEHNWDVKRLIKTIVMSQTYQQSSNTDPAYLKADPDNRLLGRAPTIFKSIVRIKKYERMVQSNKINATPARLLRITASKMV